MTSRTSIRVDWPVLLEDVAEACRSLEGGEVARYIPALATVDPDQFAVAICTVGGDVIVAGDAGAPFTLQSMCKPFLYGTALSRLGAAAVRSRVGVEPTGEPFDSFVRLERGVHRPHNPMVNAGAITIASLLLDDLGRAAAGATELVEPYAGASLSIDEATYVSEAATADRNRAIAHLLAYFRHLSSSVEDALDFYFRCCSVQVRPRDLAVMGGVLAAGGRNPLTHERVLSRACVRDVLRVMTTCGMYDGSGRFAFEVGVPAKSGVSGGVLGVVPGDFAIGVYSPRLDAHGNSVRGFAALRRVAERTGSHMLMLGRRKPRLPDVETLRTAVCEIVARAPADRRGGVADYCTVLADRDPEEVCLAVCDVEGNQMSAGAVDTVFSLQACANPFAYAMALAEHGVEAVHQLVGLEPSGNPFDAIPFDPVSRLPHNPLGNAGAITIASLLSHDPADTAVRLGAFAGPDPLRVDAVMLDCEREAGGRNRAIAYQLKNFGVLTEVEPALERYFHQCAVGVTAPIAARMAATLAGGGVNPITGARVLPHQLVRPVLTVMYMCGLHDYSGRFAFEVGLPAKSGIAGGILAVVPGRLGIAAFSPRVDRYGASVRGVAMLRKLARRFRLGLFEPQIDAD